MKCQLLSYQTMTSEQQMPWMPRLMTSMPRYSFYLSTFIPFTDPLLVLTGLPEDTGYYPITQCSVLQKPLSLKKALDNNQLQVRTASRPRKAVTEYELKGSTWTGQTPPAGLARLKPEDRRNSVLTTQHAGLSAHAIKPKTSSCQCLSQGLTSASWICAPPLPPVCMAPLMALETCVDREDIQEKEAEVHGGYLG